MEPECLSPKIHLEPKLEPVKFDDHDTRRPRAGNIMAPVNMHEIVNWAL